MGTPKETNPLDEVPDPYRRKVLKWGIFVGFSAGFAGGAIVDIGRSALSSFDVNDQLESAYPITDEEIAQSAKKEKEMQEEIADLVSQGNREEINRVLYSDRFEETYLTRAEVIGRLNAKKKLKAELDAKYGTSQARLALDFITFLPSFMMTAFGKFKWDQWRKKSKDDRENLLRILTASHPEWCDNPPPREEVNLFFQAVSYLPPIGGKIEGPTRCTLDPSRTAEEQFETAMSVIKNVKTGEPFVHQLTVQGRLPDRFKYSALALILTSPYRNDWNQPFFEAEWGKMAPLVHDGGNTKTGLNLLWAGVEGRTDFIQRVSVMREPNLEELEQLMPEELANFPIEKLATARREQLERERTRLESRFYQRSALALHAASGTAPNTIPNEIVTRLTERWQTFENQMRIILERYGARGAAEIPWFNEEPRDLWTGHGKRHEADWPPIQKELLDLEEIRLANPEIYGQVISLIREVTEGVDEDIGLK